MRYNEKYKWVCGTVLISVFLVCLTLIISSRGSYDINLNANKEFEEAIKGVELRPIQISSSDVIIHICNNNSNKNIDLTYNLEDDYPEPTVYKIAED